MPLLLDRVMTNLAQGSSLLQSPEPNHASQRRSHVDDTLRSLPRQHHHAAPERRQIDLGSRRPVVAQVIQTVEFVQVVDPNGVLVTVETRLPPATTKLVNSLTEAAAPLPGDGNTIAAPLPAPTDVTAPPAVPIDLPVDATLNVTVNTPGSVTNVPATISDAVGEVGDVADDLLPSGPQSGDLDASSSLRLNSSSTSQDVGVKTTSSTSAPLSTSFPTLAVPLNGTGWNATLFNNTRIRTKANKTRLFTTSTADSDGPGGLATDAPDAATNVPTPPGQPVPEIQRGGGGGPTEPPPPATVVGISVGSIAGAALILFVIMALLRWKRARSARVALGGTSTGQRGLLGGDDGSTGNGEMQQSATASTVVPGVMATLSRLRQQTQQQGKSITTSPERGFQRISGRKLPSVWEHGGDGYTDPRQSVVSGTSDHHWRDSTIWTDPSRAEASGAPPAAATSPTRLALGSPMRPVSGVPIMRSGPARTPVTEVNPFSDPPTPSSAYRPDPLGRSLTAQGSSRFAEEV